MNRTLLAALVLFLAAVSSRAVPPAPLDGKPDPVLRQIHVRSFARAVVAELAKARFGECPGQPFNRAEIEDGKLVLHCGARFEVPPIKGFDIKDFAPEELDTLGPLVSGAYFRNTRETAAVIKDQAAGAALLEPYALLTKNLGDAIKGSPKTQACAQPAFSGKGGKLFYSCAKTVEVRLPKGFFLVGEGKDERVVDTLGKGTVVLHLRDDKEGGKLVEAARKDLESQKR